MHQDIISNDAMMTQMRTTITLDPDTEALLKEAMQRDGISFKEAVNRAIRSGLSPRVRRKRFRQRTHRLGLKPGISYDKALELAAQLDDQELLRKMAQGK